MANLTASDRKKRFLLFLLGGGVVTACIVLLCVWLFAPTKVTTASRLQTGNANISGKAGGEGSHEYNERLKAHDEKQANAALAAGSSYVPSPVGQRKPVVAKKEESKPQPPAVAKVNTVKPQAAKQDNAMLKRMLEDMAQLDAKLASAAVGKGKIEYLKEMDKAGEKTSESGKTGEQKPEVVPSKPGINPGDLLYAIVDTGVNSDVPSAILATVASGKFKNARLIGSFQRHDERIVVSFNRLVSPDGKTLQVEAYAVDPGTSEASVATSVNTHFFERWGGLVAASFLSGLGEAKKFSGAQSTVYGGLNGTSDQMVWNKYNPADQAWIAAGKVGEKAAEKFEKNFDRPPTVYLATGTPIGVLVMNVKESR